jgi:hypothetical protein
MPATRYKPNLHKKRLLCHKDYTVYDTAHLICSKLEFKLRKGLGATPLLVNGHARLSERDLPRLTREEVFEFVLRTYVDK